MSEQVLLESLGMGFALLGIVFSWWSFSFADNGATPDLWSSPTAFDFDQEAYDKGVRWRARESARVTFNIGALFLAASVPMGPAATHVADSLGPFVLAAGAMVIFAILLGIFSMITIWKHRRADAFSLYFDCSKMNFLYDRSTTEALYFRLNPMPLWSLPDRKWRSKTQKPDIMDVEPLAKMDATFLHP